MASVIAYDRPVRNFIAGLDATGHVSHRSYKKTSVTIHHNAGNLSLQGILDVWKIREGSAHFQVDSAGAIGQYVRLNEYAWAVGNTYGNQSSISIEMADATGAPKWIVGETTWKSAARLAAWLHWKVLGLRPVQGKTLFRHHDWPNPAHTGCAGPFIDAIWGTFCKEVVAQYDAFTKNPKPKPPQPPANTTIAKVRALQTALEVTSDGKWGSGTDDRALRMRAAAARYTSTSNVSFDIRDVQKVIDVTVDGIWGPKSQAALVSWVKGVQKILGVDADGSWGPNTDKAFLALRTAAHNKF